jgi:hypothetical protein
MCKNCKNSTYKREDDGSIKLKCNNDLENITKHKLSKLAGLPGNAVFRAESGRQSIHRLRAKAIAEALGKKLEDLFETEECNEDLTMAV